MSIEFSYRDLKKDQLSDKALALLSEFALIWHTKTGDFINLDSDDAVLRVFRNAARSSDRRLRCIFLHLRAEFSAYIEESLAPEDAMLADKVLAHITRGRKYRFLTDDSVS